MSSLKPTNFQVKVNELSEAETEDGELGVCIDIEPALDNDNITETNLSSAVIDNDASTANIDAMEMEVDTGDDYVSGSKDAAATSADKSFFSDFKSTSSSFFLNKKTAATTFVATMLLGTVAVVGIYMNSINDDNNYQQQEALSDITGHQGKGHGRSQSSRSKSGKSTTTTASVCLSDHDPIDDYGLDECEPKVVECGDIFTNEEIVLTHDLFCANDYWKLTDEEKQQLNRVNGAITLSGPNASIDCKGHSIRQIDTAPTYPFKCNNSILGTGFNDPFERRPVCSNYYHAGILLVDGAKAINCKAENFYDGFFILNGGELRKSEASFNVCGIGVQDVSGSIETKVSDVYTSNNSHFGIEVRNAANSNVVTIEEATSRYNTDGGMNLFGPDITVKDSTTSYNSKLGIFVGSNDLYFFEPHGLYTTKVQFEGKVSSHNNRWQGIWFGSYGGWFDDSPLYAEFTVKGDVSLYLNGGDGLSISSTPHHDILFTVEESGSLSSCHNGEIDIRNENEVSFIDEGTDGYSCESTLDWYGQGLPVCASCPDTCN